MKHSIFSKKRHCPPIGTVITALGIAVSTLITGTALTGCEKGDEYTTYIDKNGNIIVVDRDNSSYVSGGPDDPNIKNPNTNSGSENNKDSETTKERPPFAPTLDFTIDEENITAEEVLETLDNLVTDFAEMSQFSGYEIDRWKYQFYAEFDSITPHFNPCTEDLSDDKYTYLVESCTPTHAWFRPNQPYYSPQLKKSKMYIMMNNIVLKAKKTLLCIIL